MEHVQIPLDILNLLDRTPPDGLLIPRDEYREIVCRVDHGTGVQLRALDHILDAHRLPLFACGSIYDRAHARKQ